jgi:hypothetical protein
MLFVVQEIKVILLICTIFIGRPGPSHPHGLTFPQPRSNLILSLCLSQSRPPIPPPSYLEEQFRLQHSGPWWRRLVWPPPYVSPRRTGGRRRGRLPAPRVATVGNGAASLPAAEAGEAVILPNSGGQRGHHSHG